MEEKNTVSLEENKENSLKENPFISEVADAYDENNAQPLTKKARDKESVKEIKKKIGFSRFKRREVTAEVIKALLLSILVACVLGGIGIIFLKQIPLEIYEWRVIFKLLAKFGLMCLYSLGVVALVAVFFLPSVLVFRKSDKKLVRELDDSLGLKQGMQASIEFANTKTTMSTLLASDLEERTSKIKTRKYKIKGLPGLIIPALITAVFAFVTVCLPFNVVKPEGPKVNPFELTEMQEKEMQAIIAEVENSDMVQGAKENVVAELRALLSVLKTTHIKEDAYLMIELSTQKIDDITKKTGTSYELYTVLVRSDNPYTREIGRLVTLHDEKKFVQKRDTIRKWFMHKDYGTEDADIQKITEDTARLVREAGIELRTALLKSGIDESDKLYGELLSLAVSMEALASDLENGIISYRATVEMAENSEIYLLIDDGIYFALADQNKNYEVGFGASDAVRELFDIDVPSREDNANEKKPNDKEDTSEEEEEKPSDGGGINGGANYGSNDQIYDKTDGYVEYGEVLAKYYQIMSSTEYTPEQKAQIQKYFEILFKGIDEKKGE